MKKSYIKIIAIEMFMFLILILNIFNSIFLERYKLPIFLLLLIFFFYLLLGREKTDTRYTKPLLFEITFNLLFILVLYYISGLIFTFAKINNYFTLYAITTIILPLLLTIIFKEVLRNNIITKCGNNKILIVFTTILFIFLDINVSLTILDISKSYDVFLFISQILLPSISTNILLTYLVKKSGFKTSILYLLIITFYCYIIPIVPDPNKYVKCIINLLIPVIILLKINKFINKHDFDKILEIDRDYNKKRFSSLLIPITITLVLVYFISGYFKYYAIAIVSNSMNPVIYRGDTVIVKQLKNNKNLKVELNDIIAYKRNGVIIVHRVVNIKQIDNIKYYYTKGDSNKELDDICINEKDIIGIVKKNIRYIGYPTIIFSELGR